MIGIQVCSNEGPHLFPRGDDFEIAKNTVTKFKITRPDSSQNFMNTVKTIDLTHLCIQINNTVVNYTHIKLTKKSKTTGPVSSKLSTKHSSVMGIRVCSNE